MSRFLVLLLPNNDLTLSALSTLIGEFILRL